ncbi:MAG: hypothetical protein AAF845_05555 [Bacteroidota bacterium]
MTTPTPIPDTATPTDLLRAAESARASLDALRSRLDALAARCPEPPYHIRAGETVTAWGPYTERIVDDLALASGPAYAAALRRLSMLHAAAHDPR